jgi:hypothetical protein
MILAVIRQVTNTATIITSRYEIFISGYLSRAKGV